MDINSPEFAAALWGVLQPLVRKEALETIKSVPNQAVGKVKTGTSGPIVSCYINDSPVDVECLNPRGLSLSTNQLVKVIYPNFRDDQNRYVDRIL